MKHTINNTRRYFTALHNCVATSAQLCVSTTSGVEMCIFNGVEDLVAESVTRSVFIPMITLMYDKII